MSYQRQPRVKLCTLSIRTSSKGNDYLSGYLGKAKVIGFRGEPDKYGSDTWDIFVSEPEPRQDAHDAASPAPRAPAPPGAPPRPRAAPARREGGGSRMEQAASASYQRLGAPGLNDEIPF